MKYLKTILSWTAVIFLLVNSQTSYAQNEIPEKPNIIFIIVDQMNADVIGAYGNNYIKTPTLDRLVMSGANFKNAYCSQPICGPSRASMMTGSMPNKNKSVLNIPPTDHKLYQQPWLGKQVSQQGYKTAYYGKWHIAVGKDESDVHGFQTMEHTKGNYMDTLTVASAKSFLAESHENPFFLVVSINNPHNICEWARGEYLPDGQIPEPPTIDECPPLPANFLSMENEPSFIRKFQIKNPRVFPTVGWQEAHWRKYLWAYYRLIEKADARIGEVLETLDKSAYSENTLIVFTSDHGDGAAEHGWNQKSVLFENAINVPFIVCPPKKENYQSSFHTELVSTGIDIFPTILDYAGGAIDSPSLQGKSVKPFLIENGMSQEKWRDKLIVEMTLGVKDQLFGVEGRALRFEDYKYILYREENGKEHELLFNLKEDAGELNNLANSAQHQNVVQKSRKMLTDWCSEQGDDFCQ